MNCARPVVRRHPPSATSCRSPRCHIADVRGGDAELASRRADYVLKSGLIRTLFGAPKFVRCRGHRSFNRSCAQAAREVVFYAASGRATVHATPIRSTQQCRRSAADHQGCPPDRPWTEARCSWAMLPNIQGLRQKPCACSSRLTRSSYSAWTSGGSGSGSDDGRGGTALTFGHCLLCC